MYRLKKTSLYKQIVKIYLDDAPLLILSAKCYKWQNREINGKACFPRKKFNFSLVAPRYQDRSVGLYLAAQCLYWQGRGASNTCNDPKTKKIQEPKKKGVLYYTLGFMLVGTAATIAYAESDTEFREWLDVRVPGTNEFIKVIYQEEKPYGESFQEYKDKLKVLAVAKIQQKLRKETASTSANVEENVPVVKEVVKDECVYKAPLPVFTQMQKKHAIKEEHYSERRLISEKSEIIPVEDSLRKTSGDSTHSNLPETHPLNLIELEKKIGDSAVKVICTYVNAMHAMREYSMELYQLIEHSFKKPNPEAWRKLKEKALEKQRLLKDAEKENKTALENIDRLRAHLENPDFEASFAIRERAKKNVEKIMQDIEEAKKKYQKEAEALSVAQTFWKRVEETRKFFNDDLTILFPNIKTRDKNLKISDEEVELLLSHIYQCILYYQKELSKVENVRSSKFKQILNSLQSGEYSVADAMVEAEMEILQRTLTLDNEKKELAVKSEAEKISRVLLHEQAKDQRAYLKDTLAWKEVETERWLLTSLEDKLDEMKSNYTIEVAGMIGRMRGLNIEENKPPDKSGNQQNQQAQAQVLWSACQALVTALKAATNNKPWTQQLHPLQAEISAIEKAADEKDELVKAVVAAVPSKALTRGVYSKNALKERFLKVEKLATRLAQVSDGGAPGFMLFLSFIQSFLIFKEGDPIPAEELANEPIDPTDFTTYDILQRAKYWLDKDNFELTIKYMNLLQGAPKSIAKDWIKEAITLLETQQAAVMLLAHATSSL